MGKEFLETSVINWWWNSHQSSTHKSLCILGFCVVPRKGSSTSGFQRSLEEQNCRNPIREKLQRLWCYQWRVDWIRVNIFPGFTTLQLCDKINDLLSDLGQTPETFTGRILFMSMFNDISCDRKGNKDECLANAGVVKVLARRFGVGHWSFTGPGSEKKWYSAENSPQGAWDHIADEMLLEFAESGHPTFRATTPLSRGQLKSKGHGKMSIHFAADEFTIDTFFRITLFCQSAQYLRSSGSCMWRIWEPSRWIGATWDFDGQINCSRWN